MDLLAELNVPRPFSKNVKSPAEALQVIKEAGTPCIMKATAVLDDLGRNDMTLYPLKNDKAPRYPLTVQRLESGLSVPISRETPYVVQQFIKGDEWCTHATVFDNRLLAFACCPSNDMLMLYEDWTRTPIGKMARAWTEKFLKAWRSSERGKNESFTGHLSMVNPICEQILPLLMSAIRTLYDRKKTAHYTLSNAIRECIRLSVYWRMSPTLRERMSSPPQCATPHCRLKRFHLGLGLVTTCQHYCFQLSCPFYPLYILTRRIRLDHCGWATRIRLSTEETRYPSLRSITSNGHTFWSSSYSSSANDGQGLMFRLRAYSSFKWGKAMT